MSDFSEEMSMEDTGAPSLCLTECVRAGRVQTPGPGPPPLRQGPGLQQTQPRDYMRDVCVPMRAHVCYHISKVCSECMHAQCVHHTCYTLLLLLCICVHWCKFARL